MMPAGPRLSTPGPILPALYAGPRLQSFRNHLPWPLIHMRKPTVIVLLCCVVAIAMYFGLRGHHGPASTAGVAPVPVRAITVARQDVPRTLSGLGTVQSLHSVTIRPQVDGVLLKLWVKEGQMVKQGEMLASIDDRSIRAALDQAKAQLSQSQAQLEVATLDLKRYRTLSQDNGISRQQLDQQQALFNQLQATVLGNQAAIAAAQVQLSYTQIRSPVTGRVGIRSVDEGNVLRVSDAVGLFSVTRISPIAVEFSLPQATLPVLQALVQSTERTPVRAYADTDTSSASTSLLDEGLLTLIDNQVSSTTGTVRIKAEFDNGAQHLWPGQLVNVQLQTGVLRQVLAVPPRVVQRGIEQAFVYRLEGDHVVSVPVKVVYRAGNLEVIEGVDEGDTLISDGQSRLKPGARVQVTREEALPDASDSAEQQP